MPVNVQKTPEIDRTGPESQDTRDRAVAHWEQILRAGVQQPDFELADGPPSGLTDADRKAWFTRQADALRGQPPSQIFGCRAGHHAPRTRLIRRALRSGSR